MPCQQPSAWFSSLLQTPNIRSPWVIFNRAKSSSGPAGAIFHASIMCHVLISWGSLQSLDHQMDECRLWVNRARHLIVVLLPPFKTTQPYAVFLVAFCVTFLLSHFCYISGRFLTMVVSYFLQYSLSHSVLNFLRVLIYNVWMQLLTAPWCPISLNITLYKTLIYLFCWSVPELNIHLFWNSHTKNSKRLPSMDGFSINRSQMTA